MRRKIQKAGIILIIACLGFIVHVTQKAMDRDWRIQFEDKRPVFLPKGEALKWMSMGYRGLMGDWLWIRSVLYFGRRVADEDNPYYIYSEKQKQGGEERPQNVQSRIPESTEPLSVSRDSAMSIPRQLENLLHDHDSRGLVDYIYPMLDRVTTVDPHFIFPYVFGGLYVLMSTGEVDASIHLLEKGYQANPDRWELPFYLGWTHWMYREDSEVASEYLMEAVSKNECPKYVGNLLAGLTKKLDKVAITHLYLQSLYESTDNPEIRKRLNEVIQALEE